MFLALCSEFPNGNVPLGKSCERYWKCLGGYPRLQRCPAGLVFDKLALRCVSPPTEDCDVPTTTPPPIEEEELEGNNIGGGGRPQGGGGGRRRPQGGQNRPQPIQFQPQNRPNRPQLEFNDQRGQEQPLQQGPLPQQFLPQGAIPIPANDQNFRN